MSTKTYKFCFDLDGTICYTKKEGQHYLDVEPLPGAIKTMLEKLLQINHLL